MSSKTLEKLKNRLLEKDFSSFEEFTFEVFNFQYSHNVVYRQYVEFLGVNKNQIRRISDIPFLPIEFFKYHRVKSGNWEAQKEFLSSGTTQQRRSTHEIQDVDFYHKLAKKTFENVYGHLSELSIIALLPSYIEQGSSSLIEMVSYFIRQTKSSLSGFHLTDYEHLIDKLHLARDESRQVVLFGVTYALLDLIDALGSENFENLAIIETGGMKGRREEITRDELHNRLRLGIGTEMIHSEYGMTELLSQAYMTEDQQFQSPDWMKIYIRDVNDPFKILEKGNTGAINVVDLANLHSCSFIETKDVGKVIEGNRFEVLGRLDNSDIRGCNLLVT